jgi:hypothetical protein
VTISYPSTADPKLLAGLKLQGLVIPPEVDDAVVLTGFAWEARYPGLGEPVTEEEYREALHHARAVVNWAEEEITATVLDRGEGDDSQ